MHLCLSLGIVGSAGFSNPSHKGPFRHFSLNITPVLDWHLIMVLFGPFISLREFYRTSFFVFLFSFSSDPLRVWFMGSRFSLHVRVSMFGSVVNVMSLSLPSFIIHLLHDEKEFSSFQLWFFYVKRQGCTF